jgi:hypothetical protein
MKTTLGQEFGKLRNRQSVTMLEAGIRSKLSESVIWKIEHDSPVRWETVHAVLVHALRCRQGTEEYQAFHALWLKQRQQLADARPEDAGTPTLSKHAVEACRKFRILIRDMDEEQTRKTLGAAMRYARR